MKNTAPGFVSSTAGIEAPMHFTPTSLMAKRIGALRLPVKPPQEKEMETGDPVFGAASTTT